VLETAEASAYRRATTGRVQPPLGTCLVYVQRISLSDWATDNIVPPSTARVQAPDGSVQE